MKDKRRNRLGVSPDPRNPQLVEREMIWRKHRIKPKVEVLQPETLYILAEDIRGDQEEMKRGWIMSRNLELTQRNGFNPEVREEQNFVRFQNIYEAIRGLALVPMKSETKEIKAVDIWDDGLMILMLTVSDLFVNPEDGDLEDFFSGLALDLAAESDWLRDPDKLAAREKTLGLGLVDRRGRRNPGRLPLRLLSAKNDLNSRKRRVRRVGVKMNARAVTLANYLDAVLRLRESIELAVRWTLRDHRIFGSHSKPAFVRDKAQRMVEFAAQLDQLNVRPFLWSFQHTVKDLRAAAAYLQAEDFVPAELFLHRVSASMKLVAVRRRLEQLLTVVSRAKHLDQPLSPAQWRAARAVILEIREQIEEVDQESRGRFSMIPFVRQHVNRTLLYLCDRYKDNKTAKVYEELSLACKAI